MKVRNNGIAPSLGLASMRAIFSTSVLRSKGYLDKEWSSIPSEALFLYCAKASISACNGYNCSYLQQSGASDLVRRIRTCSSGEQYTGSPCLVMDDSEMEAGKMQWASLLQLRPRVMLSSSFAMVGSAMDGKVVCMKGDSLYWRLGLLWYLLLFISVILSLAILGREAGREK